MLFRCPECRTRRKDWGLFTQHLNASGHRVCTCGGYHYPHRKGWGCCHHNPLGAMHAASRQGEGPEVLLKIAASIVSDAPDLAGKVNELCASWNLKECDGSEIV